MPLSSLQLFFALLALLLSSTSIASTSAQQITETVKAYLQPLSERPNAEVSITITSPTHQKIPACKQFSASLPPNSRDSGTVYVAVRCTEHPQWGILVPAQIAVIGNYLVLSQNLPAGHALDTEDLRLERGSLEKLPKGAVATLEQAIGKKLKTAVFSGQILRKDHLQAPMVIQAGQPVRITYQGNGFAISAEGKAIHSASAEQPVQIRMPSGQIVAGEAQVDGSVLVGKSATK